MKISLSFLGSILVAGKTQALQASPPRVPDPSKVLGPDRRLNCNIRLDTIGTVSLSELVYSVLVQQGDIGLIEFRNIVYNGANQASGRFLGCYDVFGFGAGTGDGVVMTSGTIGNIRGPNDDSGTSRVNNLPGDSDLDGLVSPYQTFDASVLEFDFRCSFPEEIPKVELEYVFASEEYNENVNTEYNDVLGIFLNNVNIAELPDGTPVAVNSINCGSNNTGTGPYCELFRNNDINSGGGDIDTEMDGLTTVLKAQGDGIRDWNHIKFAIADTGDRHGDSAVLIRAGGPHQGPQMILCIVRVPVHIMPTRCPNPIDAESDGVIQVAILGFDEFDVGYVRTYPKLSWKGHPEKGFVRPIRTNYEDVATTCDSFRDQADPWNCTTQGGDGKMDLILKFNETEVRNLLPEGSFVSGKVFTMQIDGSAALGFGTRVKGEGRMWAISDLKELHSPCEEDGECCSGMCTGREPDEKQCRACARKQEMCDTTSHCCNGGDIRYCNNGKCVKCPDGGSCPPV